ncbi:MAG: ThuA domain-containing protein [Planctomycetes bacterium]|nr:ThuA domain-containing protein [Planctomycetota bacterium]
MRSLTVLLTLIAFACTGWAGAGEKTKILLIGKDRDHPYATHEYMVECALLASCLKQTKDVETVISNGWPRDPATFKDVKAIVLYTANGGNVTFDPLHKEQTDKLLKAGVGLTAVHWSTGANKKAGDLWLDALGGWFSTDFSKLNTTTTKLKQADPKHPICRGWTEYDLRDEFYLELKFKEKITPVLQVELNKKTHTVAWTYERPESNNGRSFGCVLGHFHSNFGEKQFRQMLVNGILWTAHREVPEMGAPVAVKAKDLELPPKK